MKSFIKKLLLPLLFVLLAFLVEGLVIGIAAFVFGHQAPWPYLPSKAAPSSNIIDAVIFFTVAVAFYRLLLANGPLLFIGLIGYFHRVKSVNCIVDAWLAIWIISYVSVLLPLLFLDFVNSDDSPYPWMGYKLMERFDYLVFLLATCISSLVVALIMYKLLRNLWNSKKNSTVAPKTD